MTSFASLLQTFFTDYLQKQRDVSAHTIAAYRDTFRLLISFARTQLKKQPTDLLLADLDAALIGAFLSYLEEERHNSVSTRNSRLAAIRSFFRFAGTKLPDQLELIQRVLAIPQKRFDKKIITFLNQSEVHALLATPDRTTWLGRRDYTLLLVLIQTGLRISELLNLKAKDLSLSSAPHVRCKGKGRKHRITPLTKQTITALRSWIQELNPNPENPLFPSRLKKSLSRQAAWRLVDKYAKHARAACHSLKEKSVSPHVLRHTTAVNLLQAGVDRAVIALWLGHESFETTQIYLDADLAIKEKAIAQTAPFNVKNKRFQPPDALLRFLDSL